MCSRDACMPNLLPSSTQYLKHGEKNDIFVKNAGDYAWGSVEAPGKSRHTYIEPTYNTI